jgi:hypothetical protein
MDSEGLLRLRTRQLETTRRAWVAAAERALADIPGASRSDHPAHDLWLRVQMANAPPVEIVQS